jgi:hypothetical protein
MLSKTRSGNLDLARRIRAAGIPIFIPEDDADARSASSDGLRIRQFGGLAESAVFDWAGGTGFIVWVIITIRLSGFAVSSFDLEIPWEDPVRLLEDPMEIEGVSRVYRFGGWDSLEFNRDEVLNHRADVQRIMPRGSSLKGCLLGIGTQSIPEHFPHGATIPAFVTVSDQYMHHYRSAISLWASRPEKLRRAARPKSQRKRLFECPDSVFDPCRIDQDDTKVVLQRRQGK